MKVKTILVSQPAPKSENSPYQSLIDNYKVKVDFRPFIHVEGATGKQVREQRVDLNDFSAIILTSRNSVDHFFRVAEEMRYTIPNDLKYFCQSEAVAYYLQKYVVYRKRKIYVGKRTFAELIPKIKKHKKETFLLPSSDKLKPSIPQKLDEINIEWKSATFFRTVISDLSDLADVKYDILVFFSPSGIHSLFENFPDFEQGKTLMAVFGKTTAKAAKQKDLRLDIQAPTEKSKSMTGAIKNYIDEH